MGEGNRQLSLRQLNLIEYMLASQCFNTIKEFENFSYIKDKKTGQYTEAMTHEYSHAIDGLGYAYSDIYTQTKLKSLNKAVLNL